MTFAPPGEAAGGIYHLPFIVLEGYCYLSLFLMLLCEEV